MSDSVLLSKNWPRYITYTSLPASNHQAFGSKTHFEQCEQTFFVEVLSDIIV